MSRRYREAAASMAKSMVLRRTRYLILHVTSRCNARCRMCFNWDGMEARREHEVLSLDNIIKLSRGISGLPQLSCSGGEPLLRDDLGGILEAFYLNSGTRFFTVPTNALMPERAEALAARFSQKCPNGFLNFCLPFHGPEPVHDGILGVPGAFKKMRATYDAITREMSRDNVSCTLNFVMSKFNWEHYKTVVDMATADFPEGTLGIAFARGQTHEREAVDFPVDAYERAQAYLTSKRRNKPRHNPFTIITDSIAGQISGTVASVARRETANLNCNAGRSLLVVYDNGAVFPCETLETAGLPPGKGVPESACLGDLASYDFDLPSLLQSAQARRVLDYIAAHPCACTWECAIYNSILCSPRQLAKLGLNSARRLFRRD